MSNNKWKEIWEKRTDCLERVDRADTRAMVTQLKRIDGFDISVQGGDGLSYDAIIEQNESFLRYLSRNGAIKIGSIFDVGCGCGANLYLFRNAGLKIGGVDYSTRLIEIARKVFDDSVEELICGEGIDLSTDVKYDAVISNSVFSYFPSEKYAETVLDKMLEKANYSIGVIDIHDIDKKDEFIAYRRKNVENYDEKYKDLHKFFYRREFFMDWAKKNNLDIIFCDSDVEGYWNNEFVFNVYFYKGR